MLFQSGRIPEGSIALCGCRIPDPGTGELSERLDVLVEGGVIREIGREARAERRIRMEDWVLLPGFVDVHAHLSCDGSPRALERFPELHGEELLDVMRDGMTANLIAGVTAVRDLGSPAEAVRLLKRSALPASPTPDVFLSGPVFTPPGGHACFFNVEYEAEMGIRALAEKLDELGTDWFKLMATGGRSTPGSDTRCLQYSDGDAALIVELAGRQGKRVACHAHSAGGIDQCIRAGAGSVEHASEVDGERLRRMRDCGVWWVPTVCAAEFVPGLDESAMRRVGNRMRMLIEAERIGAPFACGTDAGIPYVPHGAAAREALAMIRAGVRVMSAINALTRNGAALLGMENAGIVRPGFRANMIAFPRSPYEKPERLLSPGVVFMDGRALWGDGGRICVPDSDDAIRQRVGHLTAWN